MTNPLGTLMLAVLAPVGCGAVSLLLPRRALGPRVAVALAAPVLSLWMLGSYVAAHGTGSPVVFAPWMPGLRLDLRFNPDQLGLFFAFLISGMGLLIVLYARAYFGPDHRSLYRFYPSLLLFMTAMLGVVLSDSLMLLLLFWELTSISSFLLIGWERDDPAAVKKAMQAFIVTGAGGLMLMGGLILVGVDTGYWSFSELLSHRDSLAVTGPLTAAFVMIFAGAAAKSAQFPLHFWLPGAMAAPTPVSAYLHSATMVKAGVYLLGRLWPILAVVLPLWPRLIIPIGAVTMVYGAWVALQKTDLKQIFAYTTVSQLGLLVTMYGLSAFRFIAGGHAPPGNHAAHAGAGDLAAGHGHGAAEAVATAATVVSPSADPNLIWDVTQVLNHALYKAPLFILAGAIGHIASRQLPELRGLFYRGRTARIMTVVMLLAAYALAAGPLTVSFTAKEFFFYQIWHGYESTHSPWFYPLIAAGVCTGMLNVAIFIRLFKTLMSRPEPAPPGHHDGHGADGHLAQLHGGGHSHGDHGHETGVWPTFLWIPGAVVVAFQYIGGMIPGAYEGLFGWLEPSKVYFDHFPMTWQAHAGGPLWMSLTAIGLGVALGLGPIWRGVFADPFDRAYPGFYTLVTRGGGALFGRVQRGHVGGYLAMVSLAMVGLFVWSIDFDLIGLIRRSPDLLTAETGSWGELIPGVMLTFLVCLTSVLMPIVRDRASRVLILGACGFSITAVYYLYRAPDLALTQISIEIVSLVVFLLVLSLLPDETPKPRRWVGARVGLSVAVGAVMFWLTATSSVATRPVMPYLNDQGQRFAHLGDYFLRNSLHGRDAGLVTPGQSVAALSRQEGVAEVQTPGASGHGGGQAVGHADAHGGHGARSGGGRNVVNVILVDFRGFDTVGEITVLGLAAMGVWMLLRRRHGFKSPKERIHEEEARLGGAGGWAAGTKRLDGLGSAMDAGGLAPAGREEVRLS